MVNSKFAALTNRVKEEFFLSLNSILTTGFSDEMRQPLTLAQQKAFFTREDVQKAMNKACNDIIDFEINEWKEAVKTAKTKAAAKAATDTINNDDSDDSDDSDIIEVPTSPGSVWDWIYDEEEENGLYSIIKEYENIAPIMLDSYYLPDNEIYTYSQYLIDMSA